MANSHSLDLEATSSQYASIDDASQTGLDLNSDLTIELWCRFESLPAGGASMALVAKSNTTTDSSYFFRWREGSGYEFRYTADGTTYATHDWAVTPSTDTWYHLAVVLDISASAAELFIDGSSQGTDTRAVTSIKDSTVSFRIGAMNATPASFFDGLIDDVRIWSDMRTSTEINNNMDVQLNGDEANLVAYWRFNNDYLDQTSNNNDLTSSGSPVFSSTVPFVGNENYTATFTDDVITMTDSGITRALTKIYSETITLTESISKAITRRYSDTATLAERMLGRAAKPSFFSEEDSVEGDWTRVS